MIRRVVLPWMIGVGLAAVIGLSGSATAGEIVIDRSALQPAVLVAEIGEQVIFANHSGRPVHVEFGVDPDRHHVFQVTEPIWAVFHRPGAHAYAVHIDDGGIRELRGVVEIVQGATEPSLPACAGFVTVMGICLEP